MYEKLGFTAHRIPFVLVTETSKPLVLVMEVEHVHWKNFETRKCAERQNPVS
jgi:hypothetical protein